MYALVYSLCYLSPSPQAQCIKGRVNLFGVCQLFVPWLAVLPWLQAAFRGPVFSRQASVGHRSVCYANDPQKGGGVYDARACA